MSPISGISFRHHKKQRDSSPDPIVRGWLDTEGGKYHKALGGQAETPLPTAYRPQPAQSSVQDAKTPLEFDASSEELREALTQYQKLDVSPRLAINIEDCNWDDVFNCMADANAEYDAKAKGWKGFFRKTFRLAGDKADDLEPVLGLVPDEYGLGVLCAGISLVFMLAKRAAEHRETILAAFEEIPAIVATGKAKLKLQPNDKVLQAASNKLNVTVLVAVSQLVASLLPDKYTQKGTYFWHRRRSPQADVESVLRRLRKDADELKDLLQDILNSAILEIRDAVRIFRAELTKQTAEQTKQTVIFERMAADVRNRTNKMESATDKMIIAAHDARSSIESVLQDILVEKDERIQYQKEQIGFLQAQLRLELSRTPVQGLMTIDQFLVAIDAVDHIEQSTADIEKVLQLRGDISPTAEAQTISLLQTAVFRDWLRLGYSDLILIDGAGGAVEFIDHAERISAKSILCALFLSQLTRFQRDSFKIFFFCGLHSSSKDAMNDGPGGMMRSLLCDLAKEAYQRKLLNLDFIDDKRYRDALLRQKIEYLCDAFYQILQSMNMIAAVDLPIYCVIDGIAQYEKHEWLRDLSIVMAMFRAIVEDTKLKPCFKLLLTGPHRVRYVSDMVGVPASKRLSAKPALMGEDPVAQRELSSGAEQILQARRQEMMTQRSGQSVYQDGEYSLHDYE